MSRSASTSSKQEKPYRALTQRHEEDTINLMLMVPVKACDDSDGMEAVSAIEKRRCITARMLHFDVAHKNMRS